MTKLSFKYIIYKFLIILFENIIVLALAFILAKIFQGLKINSFSDDQNIRLSKIIVSGISWIFFVLCYVGTVRRSKLDKITMRTYTIGETVAYAVMTVIPFAVILIAGEKLLSGWGLFFFVPNMFFTYVTNSAAAGFLIHLVLHAIIAAYGYLTNHRKKREA